MNFEELQATLALANNKSTQSEFGEAEKIVQEVLIEVEKLEQTFVDTRGINGESDAESNDKFVFLRAHANLELALISLGRSNFDEAIALCNGVLASVEKLIDFPLLQKTWNILGRVYNGIGNYDLSLEYYGKVLTVAPELGEETFFVRATGNIGIVYGRINKSDLSIQYSEKALIGHRKLGEKRSEGGVLVNISIVYTRLGEFDKALERLNEAMSIFEEIGEVTFMLSAMANIAGIHLRLKNYNITLEYAAKILAEFEKLGLKSGIAQATGSIGWYYSEMGQFETALEYMKKAFALQEELGNKRGMIQCLTNIGNVYKSGQPEQALECFLKVLEYAEEHGATETIANAFADLGDVYANPNFDGYDAAKAEEYMLKSLAMNTDLGLKFRLLELHKAFADLYEHENRSSEALTHYKKYHELEKDVLSEEAKKQANLTEQRKQTTEREKILAIERERSDATTKILHQVLPPSIADRLIKGEKIADYFQVVSILFADIVGFTPIASKMPARKVLAFLNYVFGEFDRIIEKHGCEKIKTIGDGYMAVAGAPIISEDHAERIATAAVEMMGDIELPDDIQASLPKGAQFSIRIGINIGPAFGGIVGEKRFVYDIYSDAVNTAARMESHGEPGKIHVSQEFAFHLQNRMDMTGDDLGGIVFVEREEIEIKGKGWMKTYFLEAQS